MSLTYTCSVEFRSEHSPPHHEWWGHSLLSHSTRDGDLLSLPTSYLPLFPQLGELDRTSRFLLVNLVCRDCPHGLSLSDCLAVASRIHRHLPGLGRFDRVHSEACWDGDLRRDVCGYLLHLLEVVLFVSAAGDCVWVGVLHGLL